MKEHCLELLCDLELCPVLNIPKEALSKDEVK
jgi:hypothetical protein